MRRPWPRRGSQVVPDQADIWEGARRGSPWAQPLARDLRMGTVAGILSPGTWPNCVGRPGFPYGGEPLPAAMNPSRRAAVAAPIEMITWRPGAGAYAASTGCAF